MLSKRRKNTKNVEFEQVLLDATNVSMFDQNRLEGRLELPIENKNLYYLAGVFLLTALILGYGIFSLQILEGSEHHYASENISTVQGMLIAERGVIYDRNKNPLAWNEFDPNNDYSFPTRSYTDHIGVGQLLGYVSYPQKDSNDVYWRTEYLGRNGVEGIFNQTLAGENGKQIVEVDALGEVLGRYKTLEPKPGNQVVLSIDVALSQALYDLIATSSKQANFRSGAAAIMDVHSGEIIAMTSFPSYDPQIMADGSPSPTIEKWNQDERYPFLNKVVGGVYTPGSVVKPFLAYAALEEEVVTPDTEIVSTGELVIPNPYNPDKPTIFRDWRAHGKMDLREGIAFSSNVYMYYISGGYKEQEGVGIEKMNKYFNKFGFGRKTGINLDNEQIGVVPSPEWKQENFSEDWLLGDTYNTAIGQFGWQTTPLQILRAYAALANGGFLVTPHIQKDSVSKRSNLNLDEESLKVVQEGMRMAVNYDGGTARSLERDDVEIAAKSGTAQVGVGNAFVNSWAAGYFPYQDPQYAFVLLMERAPQDNTLGATTIMGRAFDWMAENAPDYLNP